VGERCCGGCLPSSCLYQATAACYKCVSFSYISTSISIVYQGGDAERGGGADKGM